MPRSAILAQKTAKLKWPRNYHAIKYIRRISPGACKRADFSSQCLKKQCLVKTMLRNKKQCLEKTCVIYRVRR